MLYVPIVPLLLSLPLAIGVYKIQGNSTCPSELMSSWDIPANRITRIKIAEKQRKCKIFQISW